MCTSRRCTRHSCAPRALFDAPLVHVVNDSEGNGGKIKVRPASLFVFCFVCSFAAQYRHVMHAVHAGSADANLQRSRRQQLLQQEARKSDWLLIATDADREGENIGFEIIELCQQGATE